MKSCNPIGIYTKQELIALEHEWRLKLKKSGFQDIEKWDNRPNKKVKRLRFIRGHVRYSDFKGLGGFIRKSKNIGEYLRVIALYAHHAPSSSSFPETYRKVMVEFANVGVLPLAIKNAGVTVVRRSVHAYIHRNLSKMLVFVHQLDREAAEEEETYESTYYN